MSMCSSKEESKSSQTWEGISWTEYDQKEKFEIDGKLTVDTQSGIFDGKGSDDKGSFTLRGFINADLHVDFIKSYNDTSEIVYFKGRLNLEHSLVSGTYGSSRSKADGNFELRSSDFREKQETCAKAPEWKIAYEEAILKHK
jgi:hypothetical protein